MTSYRALAWKELLTQKVTSVLVLLAMILSTMMTTAVGQSAGILAAMREQQAIAIGGNRYATLVQMDREQVETLRGDRRLSYTGVSIALGTLKLNNALTLGLTEYIGDSLDAYPSFSKIKEGRLPERAMEIALPEDVLQFLGFKGGVGDPISISASKALRHGIEMEEFDFTAEFLLTGILESNYLGYTSGSVQGIVGAGTAEKLLPGSYLYYNVDIRTAGKKSFQDTMDALASELQIHELDTLYHVTYLNALGIPYRAGAADMEVSDTGFPFLMAAGVLVVILILSAAGLVIYNILKVAVSRRIRQYGTLRAMGAEKGQLYSIVVIEVLLLCVVGIPAGMALGLLSAKGILTAAVSQLSPDIFLAQDAVQLNALIAENGSAKGMFLLFSAAITLIFAMLAALPAARFAAKVSPVVAMSGTNAKIKRKVRGRKIRNFERYYAGLNLKRNRGRTAITVLSLVMSITVFISLQGFIALLNVAGTESDHLGDYSVTNEITGFSTGDLNQLGQDENIAAVAAMQFSLYLQNDQGAPDGISIGFPLQAGETFQLVGLNDAYWEGYFDPQLPAEQLNMLKTGRGCVVRNPIPLVLDGQEITHTEIQEGDTITVAGKAIPVLKTLDGYDGYFSVGNSGFTNGVQVAVNTSLYSELTGNDVYAELLPILKGNADRKGVDTLIDGLCQQVPGTTAISFEQTDRQLENSFAQINLLAWGFILFIGLIGILNIINTVYTNIHTRVTEIGTQRAIGMSVGSLYKTFLWEAADYGTIAAIFGSALGYLCTIMIEAAATNAIHLAAVPVIPMLEATILSVVACLAATCIPLRKMAQMNIVESIETAE